eukprot:1670307-Amphidinium_carterae.1
MQLLPPAAIVHYITAPRGTVEEGPPKTTIGSGRMGSTGAAASSSSAGNGDYPPQAAAGKSKPRSTGRCIGLSELPSRCSNGWDTTLWPM